MKMKKTALALALTLVFGAGIATASEEVTQTPTKYTYNYIEVGGVVSQMNLKGEPENYTKTENGYNLSLGQRVINAGGIGYTYAANYQKTDNLEKYGGSVRYIAPLQPDSLILFEVGPTLALSKAFDADNQITLGWYTAISKNVSNNVAVKAYTDISLFNFGDGALSKKPGGVTAGLALQYQF